MISPAVQREPDGPVTGAPKPDLTPTRPTYDGKLGELYAIYFRHLFLMVLTLGWSRFWGRTRLRRYLWNHLSVLGDRFEYRGRGLELFLGFVLAIVLIASLMGGVWLVWTMMGPGGERLGGVSILDVIPISLAVIGFPLAFVGHYAGLRYKLSRTRWRGIRLGMTGSAWAYGARATALSFANAMTGQLLLPVVSVSLARPRIANAHVGTQSFQFAGRASEIYGRYIGYYFLNIVMWVVAVGVAAGISIAVGVRFKDQMGDWEKLTSVFTRPGPLTFILIAVAALALYTVFSILILPVRCWWQAYLLRYLVSHTRAGPTLFATGITTRQMWGFMVLNYLILLVTLGLGWPWVIHRTLKLIAAELWIYGTPDGGSIRQPVDGGPGYGEGLLDMFDIGAV